MVKEIQGAFSCKTCCMGCFGAVWHDLGCYYSTCGCGQYDGGNSAPYCQSNYYCPGDGGRYPCTDPPCPPGNYYSVRCNTNYQCVNNACSICPANNYCPGNTYAYPCTNPTCTSGNYYSDRCDGKTNNVCSVCKDQHYCPGNTNAYPCTICQNGTLYAKTSCTSTTDTICANCSTCVGGFVARPCTSQSDILCIPCPRNSVPVGNNPTTYLDCVCKAGFYGRVYNATYSTCSPCPSGKYCPGNTKNTSSFKVCLCNKD